MSATRPGVAGEPAATHAARLWPPAHDGRREAEDLVRDPSKIERSAVGVDHDGELEVALSLHRPRVVEQEGDGRVAAHHVVLVTEHLTRGRAGDQLAETAAVDEAVLLSEAPVIGLPGTEEPAHALGEAMGADGLGRVVAIEIRPASGEGGRGVEGGCGDLDVEGRRERRVAVAGVEPVIDGRAAAASIGWRGRVDVVVAIEPAGRHQQPIAITAGGGGRLAAVGDDVGDQSGDLECRLGEGALIVGDEPESAQRMADDGGEGEPGRLGEVVDLLVGVAAHHPGPGHVDHGEDHQPGAALGDAAGPSVPAPGLERRPEVGAQAGEIGRCGLAPQLLEGIEHDPFERCRGSQPAMEREVVVAQEQPELVGHPASDIDRERVVGVVEQREVGRRDAERATSAQQASAAELGRGIAGGGPKRCRSVAIDGANRDRGRRGHRDAMDSGSSVPKARW